MNGAKINTKNTSLAGAAAGSSYAKVYGNDNSVYLTAKLDYVRFDGTDYAAVISSADNVVTNIDKADITTENSTTVAAKDKFNKLGITSATAAGGVYTLYNDKGYVIAAMVVGKDSGATSNLVYVHTDDVERERYNPKTGRATTDGDWTWVRKVIFEGEEIELTETGDNLQYINASSMVKGNWYKVTFNANNEVISSADVFAKKADMEVGPGVNSTAPAAKAEAIYRAMDINPSINEYDTVVFQREYVGTKQDLTTYTVRPSLTGNTLYVETLRDTGVRVAEDVKTVLVQTKANKEETTYYTTSTQLKNIIDDLNSEEGKSHDFEMNLVILKGAVRYVVIRDYIKSGYKPAPGPDTTEGMIVDINYTRQVVTSIKYTGTKAPTEDDCVDAIIAELTANGYTVKKTSFKNSVYTFSTTNKNGIEKDFTWTVADAVQSVTVTIDGVKTVLDSTKEQNVSDIATAGKVKEKGTYVKQETTDSDGKALTKWLKVTGGKATPKDGDKFTFGYYEVKVKSAVTQDTPQTNVGSGITAALKSPTMNSSIYTQSGKVNVVITVTNGATVIEENKDGVKGASVTSNTGKVVEGAHIESLAANASTEVTVEINVNKADVEITLTASDYKAPKLVTINREEYDIDTFKAANSLTTSSTYKDIGKALNLTSSQIGTFVQVTDADGDITYLAVSTAVKDSNDLKEGYSYLFDSFIGAAGLKDGEAEKNVEAVKAEIQSVSDNQNIEKVLADFGVKYAKVELDKKSDGENSFVLTPKATEKIQLAADGESFGDAWGFASDVKTNTHTVIVFTLKVPEGAMGMKILDKPDGNINYVISSAGDDSNGDGKKDVMVIGVPVKVDGEGATNENVVKIEWYADEAWTVKMGSTLTYTIQVPADQVVAAPVSEDE